MKILFASSVFPNAIDRSRGCFNESLVRALATRHHVDIVSPIPWVDLVKGYRRGIGVPMYQRIGDPGGIGIYYTPFLYTPKILRNDATLNSTGFRLLGRSARSSEPILRT